MHIYSSDDMDSVIFVGEMNGNVRNRVAATRMTRVSACDVAIFGNSLSETYGGGGEWSCRKVLMRGMK